MPYTEFCTDNKNAVDQVRENLNQRTFICVFLFKLINKNTKPYMLALVKKNLKKLEFRLAPSFPAEE